MRIPGRSITRVTLLAAVIALLSFAPRQQVRAQDTPEIAITAKRFEFVPNQVTLKKGQTVKLVLTSQDVVHGFFLKPLKIDEIIEPGKPTTVTVTPQVAGTFTTICDHFCGVNHGNMKMTIVVTE